MRRCSETKARIERGGQKGANPREGIETGHIPAKQWRSR